MLDLSFEQEFCAGNIKNAYSGFNHIEQKWMTLKSSFSTYGGKITIEKTLKSEIFSQPDRIAWGTLNYETPKQPDR